MRIDGVGNGVREVRLRFLTQIPNGIEIKLVSKFAIFTTSEIVNENSKFFGNVRRL